MEKLLKLAVDIATTAHAGQVDKGGRPYINHPTAVAAEVETTRQKIVAYLHDVIEDTDVTADRLLEAGFPQNIVNSLKTITKQPGVSYADYLAAVKADETARAVKISDIRHNMDISRIENPTTEDFARVEKYKKALAFLTE